MQPGSAAWIGRCKNKNDRRCVGHSDANACDCIKMRFYLKRIATMTSTETTVSKAYMCLICGFIYDEAAGLPDDGIAPGTSWDDVPMNWVCPECGARKDDFELIEI